MNGDNNWEDLNRRISALEKSISLDAIFRIQQSVEELAKPFRGQLFDIGGGMAVNFNPGGKFHGWLFTRTADGGYVSVTQLNEIAYNLSPIEKS